MHAIILLIAAFSDVPTADWFKSLLVPGYGSSCCDQSDCHPVEFQERSDGWYAKSKLSDAWVKVPEDRIIGNAVSPFESMGVLCEFWHPAPDVHVHCAVLPRLIY